MIATAVSVPASQKRWIAAAEVAVLGGFCAFLFFFGLGSFGLIGADEPRYAQIAREMVARHDWITPVLNGQPWLEKPPLYYWGAMLAEKILGSGSSSLEWVARLPSAVFATVMIFAVYAFVRRMRRGGHLDAALMTASAAGVIGFARGASTDMPLAATFAIGMLAWYMWLESGHRRWLAVFYAGMALGTLAKGPVAAALAALIVIAFAAFRREWRLVWQTLWWPGLLLFFVISLPWYVAVQLSTGDFFRVFILEHNLARFGTNLYRHKQPFWYYIPVLLASVLPWTVVLVAGVAGAVRRGFGRKAEAEMAAQDRLRLFLLIWIAVIVVFFSFSQSKLPGYILPAVPACTILAADWLSRRAQEDTRAPWWLALPHSAVAGSLLTGALLAPHFLWKLKPPLQAMTVAIAAGMVVLLITAVTMRFRGIRMMRFVTLIPVVVAIAFIVRVASPLIDATQSARPVAQQLFGRSYRGGTRVLAFHVRRELEYGLDYYGRPYGVPPVVHYEGGPLPYNSVMIVAPRGSEDALRKALPAGAAMSQPLPYAAQHVELYEAVLPFASAPRPD